MPELTIQPTAKFLKAGVIATLVLIIGLDLGYLVFASSIGAAWLTAVPFLLLIFPAMKAARRRFTKTTIVGDRMRHETGITTKSTRNIQMSKIQDVRVDQRLMQRIFNVGDLSIETAGESSRLTIHNVDAPQALADEIMNRVQKGPITA